MTAQVKADLIPDRQILRIGGADRLPFLQGLASRDVAPEGLSYAALLTPQGKYLADFLMFQREDAVFLDVKADQAPGLVQRLSMYKLRADVTVEPVQMPVYRGGEECPEGAMSDPRGPLGWRFYGPLDAAQTGTDWDALRVEHGIPEAGIELIPNDSYILEMGFERLQGVDFKKGCYVGQEVTARMKHKTELKKGLVQVALSQPVPVGTEITSDGKAAGTVYTQAGGRGLAYLNFNRAKGVLVAAEAEVHLL